MAVDDEIRNELLALTADIVSAHLANNRVEATDVAELISSVHGALSGLAEPVVVEEAAPQPAVPVRSSVKHDYLVCLEDGKKLKMLKRYLRTNYAMTPEQYRTKWGLPRDYPMVAPAYAEQRRGLAQQIGLGRKRADAAAEPTPAAEPARRGRKPKAEAAEAPLADAPPRRRGRPRKNPAPADA